MIISLVCRKHRPSRQTKATLFCNTFAGCQTSIARKSQEMQCILLKEYFTTLTQIQSDEELSDNEGEMEQNDPSYVPDPKKIALGSTVATNYDYLKRASPPVIHSIIHREFPQNVPPHQQNLFLVALFTFWYLSVLPSLLVRM